MTELFAGAIVEAAPLRFLRCDRAEIAAAGQVIVDAGHWRFHRCRGHL
jgi:hypothetical protein